MCGTIPCPPHALIVWYTYFSTVTPLPYEKTYTFTHFSVNPVTFCISFMEKHRYRMKNVNHIYDM